MNPLSHWRIDTISKVGIKNCPNLYRGRMNRASRRGTFIVVRIVRHKSRGIFVRAWHKTIIVLRRASRALDSIGRFLEGECGAFGVWDIFEFFHLSRESIWQAYCSNNGISEMLNQCWLRTSVKSGCFFIPMQIGGLCRRPWIVMFWVVCPDNALGSV